MDFPLPSLIAGGYVGFCGSNSFVFWELLSLVQMTFEHNYK